MKQQMYIVYRVSVRLHEQGDTAVRGGRYKDFASIFKLIGKLEYQHFGVLGFEESLTGVQ